MTAAAGTLEPNWLAAEAVSRQLSRHVSARACYGAEDGVQQAAGSSMLFANERKRIYL